MKKISLLFIVVVGLLCSAKARAQNDINQLNDYKYIVIPLQYEFQDSKNEYLLNSLTKHLLKEEGFETYMDVEKMPKDMTFNRCLALNVIVISETDGFFSLNTRLKLIFKDCSGKIVYSSKGFSGIKSFKEAHQEALRDAFKSFSGYNYAYNIHNKFNVSQELVDETKSSEKVEKKDSNISSEPLLVGTYTLENKNYKVEKIEAGFILKNKTTGEREAFINKTSNNSILYNSESINGTLTLSPENNLEVEYFNKESGALEKIIFIRVE
jgi:hypothetical protein